MPAFWIHRTKSSCKILLIAKTHLYGVVEREFPVVQWLGIPCLPKVGSHRFSDL